MEIGGNPKRASAGINPSVNPTQKCSKQWGHHRPLNFLGPDDKANTVTCPKRPTVR
jgi:hypothetical protein